MIIDPLNHLACTPEGCKALNVLEAKECPAKKYSNGCCKECFHPSYDKLVGPDYMIAEAMPEGCKDEECDCHQITNP